MCLLFAKRIFYTMVVIGLMGAFFTACSTQNNWRTASRDPVGIAPEPSVTPEAIIQVYGARAYSWRGYFGIHTWIAVKPSNAESYTIYEVLGWRKRRQLPVLAIYNQIPDRRWFGNTPVILAEKRGSGVDNMIKRLAHAVDNYPYSREYTLWPGPNSNTFTAWISRNIPELELNLPATAIGKDYLGYRIFDVPPSGTGLQFSLLGILGFAVSSIEGLEFNFLGLVFGINLDPLVIKLPIAGNIQLDRAMLSTGP